MIRRGDFVVVALPGDFGKPRPALVVGADAFASLPSVAVCPLSTYIQSEPSLVRLFVRPTRENGLMRPSQIAIDRLRTAPRETVGAVIGRADDDLMLDVNRALAVFLGIV